MAVSRIKDWELNAGRNDQHLPVPRTAASDRHKQIQTLINKSGQDILKVAQDYVTKIRELIRGTVLFLLHYDSELGYFSDTVSNHQMKKCQTSEGLDEYHVLTTIWYVFKNCREAVGPTKEISFFWDALSTRWPGLYDSLSVEPRQKGSKGVLKRNILRTLHFASAISLTKALKAAGRDQFDEPFHATLRRIRRARDKWQDAARQHLSAKVSTRATYVPDDEGCDRLLALTGELGFSKSIRMLTHMSRQRIENRSCTSYLNPGLLLAEREGSFPIPRDCPWELHLLCHHSPLLYAGRLGLERIEHCITSCLEFRTAEGLLAPSWERGNSQSLAAWFSLEASCVVATTLVGLRLRNTQLSTLRSQGYAPRRATHASRKSTKSPIPLQTPRSPLTPVPPATPHGIPRRLSEQVFFANGHGDGRIVMTPDPDKAETQGENELTDEVTDSAASAASDTESEDVKTPTLLPKLSEPNAVSRLAEIFEAVRRSNMPNNSLKAFHWKEFKPTDPYHPPFVVNSLDDTPDLIGIDPKRSALSQAIRKTGNPLPMSMWFERGSVPLEPEDFETICVFDIMSCSDISTYAPGLENLRVFSTGELGLQCLETTASKWTSRVIRELLEVYHGSKDISTWTDQKSVVSGLGTSRLRKVRASNLPNPTIYPSNDSAIKLIRDAIFHDGETANNLREVMEREMYRILCDSVSVHLSWNGAA